MMQEIGGNDINSFVLLNRSISDIPAFAEGLGSAYADALQSLYAIGSFRVYLSASKGNYASRLKASGVLPTVAGLLIHKPLREP